MPANPKPAPAAATEDSSVVAGLKFRKAELKGKIDRLEAMKPEQGFDYPAAIARAKAQMAEIDAEIKKLSK